jgi:hypothetical protein
MRDRLCILASVTALFALTGSAVFSSGQVIIRRPPAVVSSNPIDAARRVDWTTAGVTGGIPTTRTRCTTGTGTSAIAAYTGTAATINTAITGCDAGHYVELAAGTFTLSSCIVIGTSSVSLRGQGADSTKLILNGSCTLSGTFLDAAIRMATGTGNIGCSTDCGGSGPNNATTWTAGYSKGATSITLNAHANLTVGHTLWLDQLNDSSDGYPATGDLYVCDSDEPCSWEGGNAWARDGRAQVEAHKVTSCGTSVDGAACTSNTIVIDPGILAPNYRAGQTPGAWWGDTGAIVHDIGIENVSIDFTGTGTSVMGVGMANCTNCWVKGSRIIFTGDGNQTFHVGIVNGFHVTVKDNYLFGTVCPGYDTGACQIQYTYSPQVGTMLLLENNIFHHNVTPVASNDPEIGSVYAYNYFENSYYSPGPQNHNSGDLLNLFEGNNAGSIFIDTIHGTHFFLTFFRNYLDGTAHNTDGVSSYGGIVFWANSRFHNAVGNVFAASDFTVYETDQTTDSTASVFGLGWKGSHGCSAGCLADDARVKATFFRWGNWDNVTSSADNTSNDQTGTRWNTGEVPSGITNYANPVPATQTLPNSLYLSAKPAFFQSIPWPPIGPDVVNGSPIANTGAHAYKIPARVCFESLSNDGSYASSYAPNSQRIKSFNAAACYGS